MKRLIVTIFSLYFVLAVIVSAIHIVFEYRNIRNQIMVDLASIHTSSAESLSTAIWNFNSEQVVKVVDGLLTLNFVSGVDINDNIDGLNMAVGDVNLKNALQYEV